MGTVKDGRLSLTWEPRHELLLSAIAEFGGEASVDQVLERLSTTPEYTTKGPKEPKLKSPEYYLGQVVRLLTSLKFVQRKKGVLRLTDKGRERTGAANTEPISPEVQTANMEPTPPEVRTVDAKSRLLLPKEFANATVTVERVSATELRIRKAVVIAEDELPFMEDSLKPLSNRDRDLFLSLIDNPPEPTPAFRKAAREYKKKYG